jgi:hypothetical protein
LYLASVKVWFCLAVATVAASVADLVIESASNAGFFGSGNFTDHSDWDILPCLFVGLVFVVMHCFCGVRKLLHGSQSSASPLELNNAHVRSSLQLLPAIYGLQILVLYAMETMEQRVVYHHLLGGSVWLGGPLAISLALHAVVCLLVTALAALLLRAFAEATVRLVQLVAALILRFRFHHQAFRIFRNQPQAVLLLRAICGVAERAPPALT